MKTCIWLDDIRTPRQIENYAVIWCKNYQSVVDWINEHGLPNLIDFDHDLGEEKSGYDVAKFVVEYCMNHNTVLPHYHCHTANPVGRDNIEGLFESYNRFINENH